MFQSLISKSKMYHNTGVFIIPRTGNYNKWTRNMRRLDIELPPFECVKYDDKGNVILKIPTPVDAYIQDVMPR